MHYRLVVAHQRPFVKAAVDTLLADYPDQLKVTPGKMVYEIQPNVDWDKGKAVQYLRHALHVDGELCKARRASVLSLSTSAIRSKLAGPPPQTLCWDRLGRCSSS